MYSEMFIWMVLGHMVGDYWAQTTWMAQAKSKPGLEGHLACTLHVGLYACAILLAWSNGVNHTHAQLAFSRHLSGGLFVLLNVVTHWFIDRYSLAAKFMEWKNEVHPWKVVSAGQEIGRVDKANWQKHKPFFGAGKPIASADLNDVANCAFSGDMVQSTESMVADQWKIAFTAPVYIVHDNLAHVMLLWVTILWLLK